MGCAEEIEAMLEIKVYEMGGEEDIFNSEAWRRAFDINKPIYTELCHEFYSTYKFDEDGFEVYFQGGLRSDENFNARDYWLSISSEEELHLSRILTSTIRRPILKWLKIKGVGSQRESVIYYGQFITKIAKRMSLLTDEVLDGLSAPFYCRSLDATTLRELIGTNERLIAEDPSPGCVGEDVPRQSYQFDMYVGVFEFMDAQHEVPLQGAYAPPGYDEEQHDQE
ncbi:hypothetical protein Tco_0323026 [Tanacetum coccineum]